MLDMSILNEFGISVLYVEDNEEIRETTVAGLELAIDNIFVASDGKEGIEIYEKNQNKIDIIISDINMPNINGLDMISHIKNIDKDIPVIFTSAHNDSEYLLKAIDRGISAFIQKPFDIVDLLEQVIKSLTPLFQQKDLELKQNTIANQLIELEQFQTIIDDNLLVVKTDIDGKITYINDSFTQVSGFTKDEIMTNGFKLFRHNSNTKYFFANLWKTIQNNDIWKGVVKNISKDEEVFYISYTICPILDIHHHIIAFYGIGTDVTHEKEYGNKMRQMHKELAHKQNNDKSAEEEFENKYLNINEKLKKALETNKNLENLIIKNEHESQKKIEIQKKSILAMTKQIQDIRANYILTKKK